MPAPEIDLHSYIRTLEDRYKGAVHDITVKDAYIAQLLTAYADLEAHAAELQQNLAANPQPQEPGSPLIEARQGEQQAVPVEAKKTARG